MEKFKSGYVSLVGKPNAGKSTLLNTLLQEKVSIVTNKPQTTRNQIEGIYTDEKMQIIFLDTPGIHKSQNHLGKIMNKSATYATKNSDLICLLAPANERISTNEMHIVNMLKERENPVFLILTKIDLVKNKEDVFNKINEWKNILDFKEIIPISSVKNFNLEILLNNIHKYLPAGEKFYNEETNSLTSSELIIQETIREKIILLTKQEIPYSVAVIVEKMEKRKNILEIATVVVVERKSQKGIIIGKNGAMLKQIGSAARIELESIFQTKILLKIFVKVVDEWRNNPKNLKEFGYY